MGVLRVFAGIPVFLGLPGVAARCPQVELVSPDEVLRLVLDSAVNRASKCAGDRQKVSTVTGSPVDRLASAPERQPIAGEKKSEVS